MILRNCCFALYLLLASAMAVSAAPILRINTNSLHPIWAQQGSSGPTKAFIELYNIGDGKLNPQVKTSHAWLTPEVEAAKPCTFNAAQTCIPVRLLLSAAKVAPARYAGVITVADSGGAFDSPQTIRVTIFINSNAPDRLHFYAPPEPYASDSATFLTASGMPPNVRAVTTTGGDWLAVSSSGMGSFQFSFTHRVQASVLSGMAAGDYTGAVTVANSAFAGDNKSVPATLHVTPQPIASLDALELNLRAVQGGAAVQQTVSISNRGRGSLALKGVTASAPWLSAKARPDGGFQVRADPKSLAPGFHAGVVRVASNAANGPLSVSVLFEVQAVSPPIAALEGVVDAARLEARAPVAPGALASVFGLQLASSTALAQSMPLPTSLAGTRVFVNNVAAPLLYVAPGQVNFQVPFETATGTAAVRVERQGQRGNTVTVPVAPVASGLYKFPGTEYAVARNASRGNAFVVPDIPEFAGLPKAAAHPGDYVVMYGSGFGLTEPPVPTGAAAGSKPLSTTKAPPSVGFNVAFLGQRVKPAYAGLAPSFVGLYQLNFQVPPGLPAVPGAPTAVQLMWPDGTGSNPVLIDVEP